MSKGLSKSSIEKWMELTGKEIDKEKAMVLLPAHEKYGFGAMDVGEIIEIDCASHGTTPRKVSFAISGYSGHCGKKFTRKTKGMSLYVMRTE